MTYLFVGCGYCGYSVEAHTHFFIVVLMNFFFSITIIVLEGSAFMKVEAKITLARKCL